MINLQVIHIRKITRYILLFLTIIIVIMILKNGLKKTSIKDIRDEVEKKEIENFGNYSFLGTLKREVPSLRMENLDGIVHRSRKTTVRGSDILIRIMNSEVAILDTLQEKNDNVKDEDKNNEQIESEELALNNRFEELNTNNENKVENDDNSNKKDNKENEELKLASKNVKIEKIDEKNIEPTYSIEFEGVKIKNQSSYKLSDEMLKDDYLPNNLKNVLIFHTHTCESYEQSEKYTYKMTGNYRTTDLNYSVVKVGDELTKQLQEYGFNVIHNKTIHDYPAYNGSYNRSLKTVQSVLKENEDIDIVIDLHRDAVGDGKNYGPTVRIDGESVAQIMLVIGSDGGGLSHPNWQKNLKIAIKIQKKAEELYPGLFRPMIVRDSRYNQQVRDGAMIIEVGATANTLDESLASMKYLGLIFNEVFK